VRHLVQSSKEAQSTSWQSRMAPKKNYKQAQDVMLQEPVEDRVVPPESIGDEEPRTREDQNEPESEEEQRSSVLFQPGAT
jgi:hypothetical protein